MFAIKVLKMLNQLISHTVCFKLLVTLWCRTQVLILKKKKKLKDEVTQKNANSSYDETNPHGGKGKM
jgi:hypothetical protein